MKLRKLSICIVLLMSCLFSSAQKKWDGEGKDNQWRNPANWSPDGIPIIGDDVILDHTWIQEAYSVYLQDTITHSVNSLSIVANPIAAIQLTIPPENIASPALHLNTNITALIVGENAFLINRSGAAAGNAITLNGNMMIQNGGRYVHGTLRGNTVLVSKLTATDVHRKGIFDFDVPGAAGYILSVSGRQFGTLQLSSNAAVKKSYSGSGNGNLTIRGDLLIADSSSLNLSINGNVMIGGNLKSSGKFQWQPSSADSTGRELQFYGDSSQFNAAGIFKTGVNFRKMVVSTGKLKLKNNVRFDFPAQGIHVSSRAMLILDSSNLSGPGWLQTDSLSTLMLGSIYAIDDTTKGAIRMATLNLHPGTVYWFTGDQEQYTGARFPEKGGIMMLDKLNGALKLTKNLIINDSIALNRGNIICNYNAILEFRGNKLSGSPVSFIKGPLKRTGSFNGDILFPIGDSSYSPTIISTAGNAEDLLSYTISYHADDPSETDSLRTYPVLSISKNEYWIMNKIVHQGSSQSNEIIRLPISSYSLIGINGQPHIIHLDSTDMKWEMFPFMVDHQYPNTVSSSVQEWKNGLYTLGELEAIALSNERLFLNWKRQSEQILLGWQISGDPAIQQFILEFAAALDHDNKWQSIAIPKTTLHFVMPAKNIQDRYIRLKGITEKGDTLTSNLVRIAGADQALCIFPNPVHDRLYITDHEKSDVIILLNDGRVLKQKVTRTSVGSFADLTSLPSGVHRIGLMTNSTIKWQAFVKR
jgi:hypothetical protein